MMCMRCGRTHLESCENGTQNLGFCAFSKCENLKEHDLDLLDLKRKKNRSLLGWFDIEGDAVTTKGHVYRTCSVGVLGNPWIIVWTPSMKLKVMKKDSFQELPEGIPE